MNVLKGRLLLFTFAILALFSISWLLSKNLIGSIPVMHAVGLRLWATTAALWLIVAFREQAVSTSVPLRSTIPGFFILSVLGFSLYFACSFGALKTLKASDLTMVLATIPGITYLLGFLSRSLGFSWLKLSGVLIVSAAALAFNASGNESGAVSLAGIALALVAAVSYAVYGLLSKRYLKDLPLLTSLAWITLISAMTFVPLFILEPAPLLLLSLEDVLKVLILGAACSAPVYVLYQKVLAEGGVLYANAIGLLAPFAVVAGEWLIGSGAALGAMKVIAMIAAVIGISLLFVDASGASGWHLKRRAPDSRLVRK
ncbi:DMT family transporter [Pseudomonas capsici]|uniref:DMT family transporter n=1 Tax=Pseudomonas capsici TaxID=2810614 RepID=UPI0021F1C2BA|nr:DMT family transporter [Pseudomonas capsici]MCV4281653.1 DMT family transporter [Pseudomonas capsici]MCV4339923.1 DMT family transporter [Pseudomonas capsici]